MTQSHSSVHQLLGIEHMCASLVTLTRFKSLILFRVSYLKWKNPVVPTNPLYSRQIRELIVSGRTAFKRGNWEPGSQDILKNDNESLLELPYILFSLDFLLIKFLLIVIVSRNNMPNRVNYLIYHLYLQERKSSDSRGQSPQI